MWQKPCISMFFVNVVLKRLRSIPFQLLSFNNSGVTVKEKFQYTEIVSNNLHTINNCNLALTQANWNAPDQSTTLA